MEIRFEITNEDIMDAVRAMTMPRWAMSLLLLLLFLMFLVGIYLIDFGFAAMGWAWLVLTLAIGIGAYWLPPFQVRRAMDKNPSAKGEIVLVISDAGTLVTFPNGRSELLWRAYLKFKETPGLFLLFFSPGRYFLVPKRAMSSEQLGQLRSTLAANIPTQPKVSD